MHRLGTFTARKLFAALLCSAGVSLAMLGLAAPAAIPPLPSGGSFAAVGSMTSARFFHTATVLGNGKILIAGGNAPTGPTNTAELFDPATGRFISLPQTMISARANHTATLLPNGKVFIAGGATSTGPTAAVEIFDPSTGSFTALSPTTMTSARSGHTATLLANGKVLLAGGLNSTAFTNTAELFDPASNTFTSLSPNTMTSVRGSHTATLLPNGKVLFTGGYNGSTYLNTAEMFDPSTGSFVSLPAMASVRYYHTATLLPTGKVLVAGGYTGVGSVTTNTAELFDPSAGTFTLLPTMTSPRQAHSATLLPSSKVLLAGGSTGVTATNTAELFDPSTGIFESLGPNTMTAPRFAQSATLLPSGKVLLAGGNTVALPQNTNTAEVFDSTAGSFTSAASLNVARFFPAAALLPSGKVLITGGQPGTGPTNTAELFDPVAATFSLLPNQMNIGRFRHTALLLPSGKVLIAGGDTSSVGTGTTNTAELFNPVSETFTLLPPMTSPRWSHTATLLPNGKVLITGGLATADFMVTNTAEVFDPASNTFTAVGSMNARRDFHTATLLANGKVLIAGGFDPAMGGLNTAELFDSDSATFTLLPNLMTTKRYYHSATLLPDGKVFIAGGGGSAPPVFSGSAITNTAELFDPGSGTFTQLPNTMNSYRYWQTATLLPNGKVLLAGGSTVDFLGSQYTRTAELFDPITGTFTLFPLMNSVRFGHTATLLPSGRVLIAAGTTGSTATNTAEIFDAGLGFADARRPVISTAPALLAQPVSLIVTGTGFRGDSETSGGSLSNSATNYPLLQLQRIDNEQSFFVLSDPATNWSDTAFTSETLGAAAPLPAGTYRITIFTNAIPSFQKIISIRIPALQLVSAVSRKTHGSAGTFDVDLPFSFNLPVPPPGIECRAGGGTGGDHTLAFTFTNMPVSGSATVTSGAGNVLGSPTFVGHEMRVNLTGVTNGQQIGVTLNVTDNFGQSFVNPEGIPVNMGVLLGDATANRIVSNTDVANVKAQISSPVTGSNFRTDVNANGIVSNTDVSATKAQVSTTLPP